MTRTNEEVAAIVVRHLSDILAGNCSITREDIEALGEETSLAEILTGLLFLHEDLTFREQERARAEGELKEAVQALADQNSELERSRTALAALNAELSAPVIKAGRDVLMLPIIGSVDSHRAAGMMDRLLAAVARERASKVILDLTGVGAIDTGTADRLLHIVGALRLLGALVIVAGIPPAVALTLTSLGVDLRGVRTARDVQHALILCGRE